MKELKKAIYYVLLALSGLFYILGIYVNFLEFSEVRKRISTNNYGDHGYDLYTLLSARQDLYYSLTWVIILSVLLIIQCYCFYKKKQRINTILGVSVVVLFALSILIYKIMTGFRSA